MNKGWRIAGALWLACQSGVVAAEEEPAAWFVDGELSAAWDSNVSRAGFERDILEDVATTGQVALAWNRDFGMMRALTLRGFAEGESHADLETLDRGTGGLQAIFRWQHALGFTAPFFQVSLAGQVDEFDGTLRDADRYTLQAFASRRLTDAFRASVGVEGVLQEADGKVHDLDQGRLFVNGDLSLNADWAVYGTYSVQVGDTVSSAQHVFCNGASAGDIYGLVSVAEAIEPDQLLTAGTCGQWLAYRLHGVTHVMVLGVNRGFGHSLSVDLSAQQVQVYADGSNEYRRTIVRAGILARF